MSNTFFSKVNDNPKKVFLIDLAGALLSAFLLGVVLVSLQSYIGLPSSSLYLLASIPLFFVVYDIICYYNADAKVASLLRIIAIANLLYCLLSIGMLLLHSDTLTIWGWVYFIGEIIIVALIAIWELRIVKQLKE